MDIELSDADYELALARGRDNLARPHATGVRYDEQHRLLSVFFSSDAAVSFDPRQIELLKNLPEAAFSQATLSPGGAGMLFGAGEACDHFAVSLPGLMAQVNAAHQLHDGLPANAAAKQRKVESFK